MRRDGFTCRTMVDEKIAQGLGFCAATTPGRHGVPSLMVYLRILDFRMQARIY